MNLLPETCRAARGLLNWTQARLAEIAGVSRSTVRDFECGRHVLHRSTEKQILKALEEAGVCLLAPGSEGPGVRLKGARGPGRTFGGAVLNDPLSGELYRTPGIRRAFIRKGNARAPGRRR